MNVHGDFDSQRAGQLIYDDLFVIGNVSASHISYIVNEYTKILPSGAMPTHPL